MAEQVLHQHYPALVQPRRHRTALWPGDVCEPNPCPWRGFAGAENAQSEISASDLRFLDSVSSRPRYVPTGLRS